MNWKTVALALTAGFIAGNALRRAIQYAHQEGKAA